MKSLALVQHENKEDTTVIVWKMTEKTKKLAYFTFLKCISE